MLQLFLSRFPISSPSGRGLGEGLTLEALLYLTLSEMISLCERNHLAIIYKA